jgi:hypothetical protein
MDSWVENAGDDIFRMFGSNKSRRSSQLSGILAFTPGFVGVGVNDSDRLKANKQAKTKEKTTVSLEDF